jgi:hypothetical protein
MRPPRPSGFESVCTSITPCPRRPEPPPAASFFVLIFVHFAGPVGDRRYSTRKSELTRPGTGRTCGIGLKEEKAQRFEVFLKAFCDAISGTFSCGDDGRNQIRHLMLSACSRPVAQSQPGPHPQVRRQRRRHISQRRTAIRASLHKRHVHPQPMPPSRALRIHALNCPARQIRHGILPRPRCESIRRRAPPRITRADRALEESPWILLASRLCVKKKEHYI